MARQHAGELVLVSSWTGVLTSTLAHGPTWMTRGQTSMHRTAHNPGHGGCWAKHAGRFSRRRAPGAWPSAIGCTSSIASRSAVIRCASHPLGRRGTSKARRHPWTAGRLAQPGLWAAGNAALGFRLPGRTTRPRQRRVLLLRLGCGVVERPAHGVHGAATPIWQSAPNVSCVWAIALS